MKKGKKSKKFSCGFYASNLKKMPGKIIESFDIKV